LLLFTAGRAGTNVTVFGREAQSRVLNHNRAI
jgi:hypothetical protein